MLITHVRPSELWGKKVYDTDGRFVGDVVAIASRRGVVRKVVVRRPRHGDPVSLLPDADARLDGARLMLPLPQPQVAPRLRVVR
jgi:sporulation protein YlmC with PRC-barrel domain